MPNSVRGQGKPNPTLLLATQMGKMAYLVHSGLLAVSHKENFLETHMINALLTMLVWSRWLEIGLFLVFTSSSASTPSWSIHVNTQMKNLANMQPSLPLACSITHMSYMKHKFSLSIVFTAKCLVYLCMQRNVTVHCSHNFFYCVCICVIIELTCFNWLLLASGKCFWIWEEYSICSPVKGRLSVSPGTKICSYSLQCTDNSLQQPHWSEKTAKWNLLRGKRRQTGSTTPRTV